MGLSVSECRQRISNREFLVRLAKLKEDWNNPDRHDVYLMQIAEMIGRTLHYKEPAKPPDLKSYLIKFETSDQKDKEFTKQELDKLTQQARGVWFQRLGMTGNKNVDSN